MPAGSFHALTEPDFGPFVYTGIQKAKQSQKYIYVKESYTLSPDLYVCTPKVSSKVVATEPIRHGGVASRTDMTSTREETKLSSTNPQQKNYSWGTTELFKWKTFKGKQSEGILYKPEDFDAKKKYP